MFFWFLKSEPFLCLKPNQCVMTLKFTFANYRLYTYYAKVSLCYRVSIILSALPLTSATLPTGNGQHPQRVHGCCIIHMYVLLTTIILPHSQMLPEYQFLLAATLRFRSRNSSNESSDNKSRAIGGLWAGSEWGNSRSRTIRPMRSHAHRWSAPTVEQIWNNTDLLEILYFLFN